MLSDAFENSATLTLRRADGGETVLTFLSAETFAFANRTIAFALLSDPDAIPLPGAALFALTGLGLGARLRRRR